MKVSWKFPPEVDPEYYLSPEVPDANEITKKTKRKTKGWAHFSVISCVQTEITQVNWR